MVTLRKLLLNFIYTYNIIALFLQKGIIRIGEQMFLKVIENKKVDSYANSVYNIYTLFEVREELIVERIELSFIYPKAFNKKWKKMNLTEKDKQDMETQITKFEFSRTDDRTVLGSVIRQSGGAIKWRFSSEDSIKGKSGSNRIIYFVYANKNYFFLDVYAKNEKENLSRKDLNDIERFINEFKKKIKNK